MAEMLYNEFFKSHDFFCNTCNPRLGTTNTTPNNVFYSDFILKHPNRRD